MGWMHVQEQSPSTIRCLGRAAFIAWLVISVRNADELDGKYAISRNARSLCSDLASLLGRAGLAGQSIGELAIWQEIAAFIRWQPDLLGEGFRLRPLPLADGSTATLVRHRPHKKLRLPPPLRGIAVLYVHGWSDYFFQKELAEFLSEAGADFYALDYWAKALPDKIARTRS